MLSVEAERRGWAEAKCGCWRWMLRADAARGCCAWMLSVDPERTRALPPRKPYLRSLRPATPKAEGAGQPHPPLPTTTAFTSTTPGA